MCVTIRTTNTCVCISDLKWWTCVLSIDIFLYATVNHEAIIILTRITPSLLTTIKLR